MNSVYFNLDEVIFFLKNGDFLGGEWFPHELDKIFEVIGVTFQKTGEKHHFFDPREPLI